jgi:hypothetical protein
MGNAQYEPKRNGTGRWRTGCRQGRVSPPVNIALLILTAVQWSLLRYSRVVLRGAEAHPLADQPTMSQLVLP